MALTAHLTDLITEEGRSAGVSDDRLRHALIAAERVYEALRRGYDAAEDFAADTILTAARRELDRQGVTTETMCPTCTARYHAALRDAEIPGMEWRAQTAPNDWHWQPCSHGGRTGATTPAPYPTSTTDA